MKNIFYLVKKDKRLGAEELSDFCSQMSTMIGSGITFPKAVNILQMNSGGRTLRSVYSELEERLRQGLPIGEAMEQMEIFPEMLVNMFYAGEMSGQLPEMAKRLADYYKKEYKMNRRIKTATLYPKILGVMSLAAMLIIFLVIIPTVEPVFEGMELPVITVFFMKLSYFLKEKWYSAVCGFGLLWLLWQKWKKDDRIRLLLDRGKLWIPMIRRPLQTIYTARFARAMSSLYAGGLTMVNCMKIAGRVIGNQYVQARFSEVIQRVSAGEMLSCVIRDMPGFDSRLSPAVFVGEETGKLDQMLAGISDNFEYEADIAVDRLISLIEPMMILMMGTVVGLILIAIMIPIWNMYGNIV